ncbi:putative exosome complex component rrp40 [Glycine max]|uniref:putative exosome complex component rrp40 n=1 Tax=Glycine max TaxID=3847 RepID=UPI00071940AF|nr:putative exosome complex component rrp40 [Glycine max]
MNAEWFGGLKIGDGPLGIVVDSRSHDQLWHFLPVLAFEGGTRRNIPRFEIGTLIYVQVVKANPGMNPELSCTDASGIAAEFGGLKDGYMFPCTMGLSRMLLNSPTCPVLDGLGQVWVNATSPHTTILVANEIMNSETLSGTQQRIMGEKLLQRIQ